MNPESAALLRAIRGPVMMITVGVLFALDNFTEFSFNRTWPILLVVTGLLSLGRAPKQVRGKYRYQAQWGPPQPPMPQTPPTPPPPPAPFPQPSGNPTAGPGSYRGSGYEATPGAPGPRRQEDWEKRERPSRPINETVSNPPDKGGTQ